MQPERHPLRIVLFIATGVFVFFATVSIWNMIHYSGMGQLTTQVAPDDVTLLLNNKQVKTNRMIYLTPGTYNWEASRQDFIAKKGSLSIKKGEKQSINIYLQPSGAAGEKWLKDHPEQARKIESGVSRRFDDLASEAKKETPLIGKLPFIAPGITFRIDYGSGTVDGKPKTTIYIKYTTEASKANALDWIASTGTDPATLTISYSQMPAQNNSIGHQ